MWGFFSEEGWWENQPCCLASERKILKISHVYIPWQ